MTNKFVAKVNPEDPDGRTYVVDQYGPRDDIRGVGYRLCLCVEEGAAIRIAEALSLAAEREAAAKVVAPQRSHVPFRRLTAKEFLELPPVAVDGEVGRLQGLVYIGAGNVYATLQGAHGDNFLISTGIKADGTFSLDVEGTDWVEVSEGLGPNGELV